MERQVIRERQTIQQSQEDTFLKRKTCLFRANKIDMTCGVLVLLTVLTTTFVIQLKLSTCDSHECDTYIHPRNINIFNMVLCIMGIAALLLYFILWSVNEKNEETVQVRQLKVNAYRSSEDNSRNSYKEFTLGQTPDWSVKQTYDVFAHFCKPMDGQYSVLCMLQIFEVSSIGARNCCTSKQGNQKHKSQSRPEHSNDEEKPLLSKNKTDDKDAHSKNLHQDPLTSEKSKNAYKDAENQSVNVDRTKALKELAFHRYTQMSGIAVIFLFIPDCATSIYSLGLNRINESYASSITVRRLNGAETCYFVYHILLYAVMLVLFMFCFYMLYGSKAYFEKLTDGKIPAFKSSHFTIQINDMSCGVLVLVSILTITFFIQLSLSTCDSPVCLDYINPRNAYIFNTVLCASGIAALVSYFILWKVNENNEEAVHIQQHKGKTDSLVKVFMWIFTFFTTLFSVISVLNGRAKKEKFNDLKSNGNITINCTYNSRYDESVFDYRIVQIIFCLLQSMFLQLTFNIRFYRCLLIKVVTFLIFWANASHFVLILVNAYVSSENDSKNSFDQCIRPYPGKIHWEIKDAYKLFARFCKPMEGEYSVLCMMQIFEVSSRGVRYYTTSDREKSVEHITHAKPEQANDEKKPLLSSHRIDNSEGYGEKLPQSILTCEKHEDTHENEIVIIRIQDDNLPKSTVDKQEGKYESLDRKKTMEKMAFYRFTHITGVAVIFLFIPDCALSIYSLAHDGVNKTYDDDHTFDSEKCIGRTSDINTNIFDFKSKRI
ncbi:unnamed protein product [Mytilus coruscus]|uniref:Uncharacterized protein n=1 Tax=Mytilus coruscus TaxID=42192 RepID=A0A6J8AB09_MYTCO|nr:unnamed protein product [Mytilus coruscus]